MTIPKNSNSRDHLSPEDRSRNMAKVKQSNTAPEVLLRKMLHKAGFRFRKNVKNLPGKPDIVLPKYKTVIFVHGCFWHRHNCRRGQSIPSTRKEFWVEKFKKNVQRDRINQELLSKEGWNVIVVWQCELANRERRERRFFELIKEIRTP
jgi:DNA mismatch endonuclease (patch repair protein)